MLRQSEALQSCTVVTHHRRFHADEVFAVAILRVAGYAPNVERIAFLNMLHRSKFLSLRSQPNPELP